MMIETYAEIAKDIAEVNQLSGNMSSSSSNVNSRAQDLDGLAKQLKKTVGIFKLT